MRMNRFRITVTIDSELEPAYIEDRVKAVLERKLDSRVVASSYREFAQSGPKSTNRPIIESYIKRTGNKIGARYTAAEIEDETYLPHSAVTKWLRRMEREGIFAVHAKGVTEAFEYELLRQV